MNISTILYKYFGAMWDVVIHECLKSNLNWMVRGSWNFIKFQFFENLTKLKLKLYKWSNIEKY